MGAVGVQAVGVLEPTTCEEWQDAIDAAQGALALHSARLYQLVDGGPVVNVGRCERMLARGRELGYVPSLYAVEKYVTDLAAGELT